MADMESEHKELGFVQRRVLGTKAVFHTCASELYNMLDLGKHWVNLFINKTLDLDKLLLLYNEASLLLLFLI